MRLAASRTLIQPGPSASLRSGRWLPEIRYRRSPNAERFAGAPLAL